MEEAQSNIHVTREKPTTCLLTNHQKTEQKHETQKGKEANKICFKSSVCQIEIC